MMNGKKDGCGNCCWEASSWEGLRVVETEGHVGGRRSDWTGIIQVVIDERHWTLSTWSSSTLFPLISFSLSLSHSLSSFSSKVLSLFLFILPPYSPSTSYPPALRFPAYPSGPDSCIQHSLALSTLHIM